MTLDTIFGTSSSLSWTQEMARGVLIFGYGLLVVRVFGRRVFGSGPRSTSSSRW
ncbi:MAG: hypothetical protein M3Y22_03560 [Pseudomonadota bacterium]|nr:hypothetical protein [Pseudomonadota bacterium]